MRYLWRHRKRGTVYEIIGPAIMQAESSSLNESACVIYRSVESGTMWVRPTCEFFDGRFEEIDAAMTAEKDTGE